MIDMFKELWEPIGGRLTQTIYKGIYNREQVTCAEGCCEACASCTPHMGAWGGGQVRLKLSLHHIHQEAFISLNEVLFIHLPRQYLLRFDACFFLPSFHSSFLLSLIKVCLIIILCQFLVYSEVLLSKALCGLVQPLTASKGCSKQTDHYVQRHGERRKPQNQVDSGEIMNLNRQAESSLESFLC